MYSHPGYSRYLPQTHSHILDIPLLGHLSISQQMDCLLGLKRDPMESVTQVTCDKHTLLYQPHSVFRNLFVSSSISIIFTSKFKSITKMLCAFPGELVPHYTQQPRKCSYVNIPRNRKLNPRTAQRTITTTVQDQGLKNTYILTP